MSNECRMRLARGLWEHEQTRSQQWYAGRDDGSGFQDGENGAGYGPGYGAGGPASYQRIRSYGHQEGSSFLQRAILPGQDSDAYLQVKIYEC